VPVCKNCGEETELKAFATYRNRKGELKRRGVCLECRQQYAKDNFEKLQQYRKEYNKSNRTERQVKVAQRRLVAKEYTDSCKNIPCLDCGRRWPPVAMDFDHVSGDKIKNISSMVSQGYNIDLIKIEISKCELVCACCHRIRTASRKENLGIKIIGDKKL